MPKANKQLPSYETNFGYTGKKKIIKNVYLYALKDCQFEIKSDLERKVYEISGKEKLQKIRTNVKGETFQISFISKTQGQKISSVEIDVDVLL